ncbi:PPA1309 family protein [Marihabitans asiaticum]
MAPVPESSPSDPVDPRDPRDPLRPEPRSRPDSMPVTEPLARCALETERHVGTAGWDQAPRVFALVETEALLAAEPQLRESMSVTDLVPGALTAIEQEGFARTSSIETLLGRLSWPETVHGAAIAIERVVVPPSAEHDLPSDPEQAAEHLAAHPDRQDVRLLAAVHRDGRSICLLRQRANDHDDQVAMGEDIAPGLVHALRTTLED